MRSAFADADLVVEARVLAHDFTRDRGFVTRLRAQTIFKGTPAATFEITAAKTCAVAFEPRTRWLVYAYDDGDGGFTTNYCSRTAPIDTARADLEQIAAHAHEAPSVPPLFTPSFAWSHDPFVQLMRLAALVMLATG